MKVDSVEFPDATKITSADGLGSGTGGGTGVSLAGGLVLIEEVLVPAGGLASIDIEFDPVEYDHLLLTGMLQSDRTDDEVDSLRMRLGAGGVLDTGANYGINVHEEPVDANEASSTSTELWPVGRFTLNANTASVVNPLAFSPIEILIHGAADANMWTTTFGRSAATPIGSAGDHYREGSASGVWQNVAVADVLSLYPLNGTGFTEGSVVRLYGVRATSAEALTAFTSLGHTEIVGDASATTFVINHGLGTRNVDATFFDRTVSPEAKAEADYEVTDANTITVTTATAPPSGGLRVLVNATGVMLGHTTDLAQTYAERAVRLGVATFFPLSEAAGTTVANEVGTYEPSYTGSPLLAQTGIDPDGTPCPEFDGTDDKIELGAGFQWRADDFSLAVWLEPDDVTTEQCVFELGGPSNGVGLFIYNGSLYARQWGGVARSASAPITANVPILAGFSLNAAGDLLGVFVNGEFIAGGSAGTNDAGTAGTDNGALFAASASGTTGPNGGTTGMYYTGKASGVAWWGRSLAEWEHRYLYDGKVVGPATTVAAAPDTWHVIGDPGEPAFENSWTNYATAPDWTDSTAAFRKDSDGYVHLRGLIKGGTVTAAAFTLPVGYRPGTRLLFATMSNATIGRVDVVHDNAGAGLAGEVRPTTPSNNAWVSLDGLTFLAEA